MRLWHEDLIPYLDNKRLLGQHRECCALRGAGWGRKHATVQYVFNHDPAYLYEYHCRVMNEMQKRGYYADIAWFDTDYRGKKLQNDYDFVHLHTLRVERALLFMTIYPEHNNDYLAECIKKLKMKNAPLDIAQIKQLLNKQFGYDKFKEIWEESK